MRRNFDPANRQNLEEQLFHRRAAGETLEQICASAGWPTRPTLRRWMREKPHLADVAAHGRATFRKEGERYPFDALAAARLLERVRGREPISALIREPGMPHRRALTAWKRARPDFAAGLAAAKAAADVHRRRFGRRRSTRRPYDEAGSDRVILALIRGATLPQLHKDPTMPNRLAFRRWRKAHPEFDGAVKAAIRTGRRARGRARAEARCSKGFIRKVELRIAGGASLHSLSKRRGMPAPVTLYKWARERPAFAEAIANASEFRDRILADDAATFALDPDPERRRQGRALRKRLGQLTPNPGAKRQGEG